MSRYGTRLRLRPAYPHLRYSVADIVSPPELNQLTGIAAILTFPLDVEVVEAEEKEAKEEEERKKAEENGATE